MSIFLPRTKKASRHSPLAHEYPYRDTPTFHNLLPFSLQFAKKWAHLLGVPQLHIYIAQFQADVKNFFKIFF